MTNKENKEAKKSLKDTTSSARDTPREEKVPKRITQKIEQLKQLETHLGHLPPDELTLNELKRRTTDPNYSFHSKQIEQQTEMLFGDICDEMFELNFNSKEIAKFINRQLRYEGGIPYCSEKEVKECLGEEN